VQEYIPHSGQEYSHVVMLQTYVLHIGCGYGSTVACGGPDPRVGMKGKRLLRNEHWMFQACELGLPLQGYGTRFRIIRFSRRLRLLLLLPHRVKTITIAGIILIDANLYLACLV
jgi:hypothetical protein